MKTIVKILSLCFLISIISCKESEQEMNPNESMEVSNLKLERVEPPHWWIGFKNQSLQRLVKDENIGTFIPEINYSGVSIEKFHSANSKNFLFNDLKISDKAKTGNFDIAFSNNDGVKKRHTYELKERLKSSDDYKRFDSSDAIFLIIPDRFANGDEVEVVMINKNKKSIILDLKRYAEVSLGGKTLINIISGEEFDWNDSISFDEKGTTILTIKI